MINTISLEDRRAFTEVYDIIMFIDKEERKKIPSKFISFLKCNKLEDYYTTINPYIPLELQKISKEAQSIISYIYLRYLANDKEKEYFKLKEQKEEEQNRKLEDSYNTMFNKKKAVQNSNLQQNLETNNLPSKINEEGIFKKLIKKIKNILFKNI